ncbi:MAG: hypothetical protein GX569_16515, partial [Candidatus Riflebacteria bacterium]|nr:hypothetical protein [Candidatus Riflebacteria bacterium]
MTKESRNSAGQQHRLPFPSPFLPKNPKVVTVKDGYNLWSEIYDNETNVLIMLEERYLYPQLA